jgi:hypothetical protein
MARKETPDVLAALLAGGELDAAPSPTAEAPPKRQPKPPSAAARAPKPARPAAPAPQAVQWEYLVVSLAQKNGWRPRYVNGKEVKNWSQAPVIHDFIAQMGQDGWEMVAAGAGKNLYGSSDGYHLFFKRILRQAAPA